MDDAKAIEQSKKDIAAEGTISLEELDRCQGMVCPGEVSYKEDPEGKE